MSDSNTVFDYVIVGGGMAGVVIASRLSQYLPSCKIALLEAGPDAVDHPKVCDPTQWPTLIDEGLVVDYSTLPQKHLNNRSVPMNLAGRFLSGSSGCNVGVWMRASSTDYAVIAEKAGHERFTFDNILPYFRRLETHWDKNADPKYHGLDGPIHTVGGRQYPLRDIIVQSAEHLGYQYNPDSAKGDPTGLSDGTQNLRATSESSSERQHSAKVYDLSGVHVKCESPVARILIDESGIANGVELVSGKIIKAQKEVIVSCGAQKTPQLLYLSGIGPKDELEKYNISQVLEAPAVGQNLFDHSSLAMYFKLKHPEKGFSLPFTGTMKPEYGQGMPWEFNAFSHISAAELAPILALDDLPGATDGTHPHLRDKRCHTLFLPFYAPILANPVDYPDINMFGGTHMAFASLHLLPVSRGSVSLRSADPKDEPIIDPKFMSTGTDRYIMRKAVRSSLLLSETEPLASELDGEVPPAGADSWPALSTKSTDEEIDARIRQYVSTIAHPMGTCALGTVLDDEFRVKGLQGLRVCDASVFPEPLGGMPMQTIYALAEMCADLIAGRVA